MEIDNQDIEGYFIGEELVCVGCIQDDERRGIKLDDILLKDDKEECKTYFCDRCKEEI
jgi:hypothetical protein